MDFKNLKLSTKFTLTVGFILLVFSLVFSVFLYSQLKNRVLENANEKTLIILTQIKAVGDYVKSTLRPKMFEILPEDAGEEFIVEAMSATHVTHKVMELFNNDLKDYVYKRVSDNPINSVNKADSFHSEMIAYFQKNKDQKLWDGVVKTKGQEFLIRMRPVVAERTCLGCHGDPVSAPKGLVERYGITSDPGWKVGDVVGVDSISVPIAIPLARIKGIALITFLFGFAALVFLFTSLEGAFWRLVNKPLRRLKTTFEGIVKGTVPLDKSIPITTYDEIGELTASFNQMAKYLHNAQEDLKKNAETLRSIFEGISDPLALVNPDCSLELTNSAYREWMTRGKSAVFTKKCHPDDCGVDAMCPVCLLQRVAKERKAISECWKGDDSQFYYVHLYPIFDDDGNVIKAVHYVKDITDRKQMDEQMRMAEKLAAVGQLSAGVAHEINNPLGGIRLCFNNLMTTEMGEETRRAHIDVINSGLAKIQDIIGQLVDFSKKSSLSVSSVSVNHLIENVLKLTDYLISKKEIKIIKNLSPDIPEIIVDRNKIEQVFLNIVLNAVHAMDNAPGTLTVETMLDGGYCKVSFSDTGPGIPDDILPDIFDPFFTTKGVGDGTGLGLSVSRSLVEQHNGKIKVETSEIGTKFIIELPIANE